MAGKPQTRPLGRPLCYKHEMLPAILEAVEEAYGAMGLIADLNFIPRATFVGWLRQGLKDAEEGIDSDLALLTLSLANKRAKVASLLIKQAMKGGFDQNFIKWWLSVTHRQDFSQDSGIIDELISKAIKLEAALTRLTQPAAVVQEVLQQKTMEVIEHDKQLDEQGSQTSE